MMAIAAFALAIGTVRASTESSEPVEGFDYPFFSQHPITLYLKPVGTGWYVEIERGIEGYSFFPLTDQKSLAELNSHGYVQLHYHGNNPPETKVGPIAPTVLPIRILPTKDGWSINFFGRKLQAKKAPPRDGVADDYWNLFSKDIPNDSQHILSKDWCGRIEELPGGRIRIELDWEKLVERPASS
jgi:hypothetical protein